nr:hypothetical protein [Tanacetum cinerariifolium]
LNHVLTFLACIFRKLKAMEARRLGDEAAYAKVTWMCILCYCVTPSKLIRGVKESVPESAKKKTSSRSSRSVVIQDTPSAPKLKPDTSKPKLKVVSAILNEGTGTKPGVLDEEKVITKEKVILECRSKQEIKYSEENQPDGEENDDKEGDADDKGDDHSSDTQDTDDEDAETEFDEDEIY